MVSKISLYCTFLCLATIVQAQKLEQYIFEYQGKKLPYQLLKPANLDSTRQYPLLLYLHGAGSRGNDNVTPNTHIKKLILDPENHNQPSEASMPMQLLMKLLTEIDKNPQIDPDCMYVTGISMGGFGTWDLIARMPERFAAAVPICGGADLATASTIAHIPIWCFHGDNDRLVPVSRSREMTKMLKEINAAILYKFDGLDFHALIFLDIWIIFLFYKQFIQLIKAIMLA